MEETPGSTAPAGTRRLRGAWPRSGLTVVFDNMNGRDGLRDRERAWRWDDIITTSACARADLAHAPGMMTPRRGGHRQA